MEFPKEFEKCPICHCKDTLCRLACADEPSIPSDTFVSMEKKMTPIQDASKISTPTTKVILRHYDTCANCGFDYCTRVEKSTISTDILMRAMGVPQPQVRKR